MSTAGGTQHTSGNALDRLTPEERALVSDQGLCTEVRAACDAFLRSRNLPVSLPASPWPQSPTGTASAPQSPTQKTMTPHHVTRESKPAPGPRQWVRKTNSTPPPFMKADFRAIVREAEKAGLVKRASKP